EFVRYPGGRHLFMHNGAISQQEDYGRRIVRWLTEHVEGRSTQARGEAAGTRARGEAAGTRARGEMAGTQGQGDSL
ncbi:hypothetical protein, partial [Streptomyces sp. NPDC056730]